MKPLQVRIPEELHRRLKIYAAAHDVEMTAVVLKLIQDFLDKEEKKTKTR